MVDYKRALKMLELKDVKDLTSEYKYEWIIRNIRSSILEGDSKLSYSRMTSVSR